MCNGNATIEGNYTFTKPDDIYLQDKKNEYDVLIMRLRHLEVILINAGMIRQGMLKPVRKDR